MSLLSSAFGYGLLADRPTDNSTGTAGRHYYASDTEQLFRDNGSGWNEITLSSSSGMSASGWNVYSDVVPTRAISDDPTYVLSFTGVDLTEIISIGMRIKFTQNSSVLYFIVTNISFSTNTTLTLYGGTDYNVLDTSTYAISDFYYSSQRFPSGFPVNRSKWTYSITDATGIFSYSPTAASWYNLISGSVPIGNWIPIISLNIRWQKSSGDSQIDIKATLSTSSSSESDGNNTAMYNQTANSSVFTVLIFLLSKTLPEISLSSKTTYYVNLATSRSGVDSIALRGDLLTTRIDFICSYF